MDGPSMDHDSDSADSWTWVYKGPCCDNEPCEEGVVCTERNIPDISEKDEDTDGISIISDTDPESLTPSELIEDPNLSETMDRPTVLHSTEEYLSDPLRSNITKHKNENVHESLNPYADILGDNTKMKTYVHRRNKRLSTVLNIIMLGSVITAAGVAIGHMWGVRDECVIQNTSSVNKILSNLYKLQEENAYLRNKLKELTLANNLQLRKQELVTDGKYQKCKKVFEESLNSKTSSKGTKCVDNQYKKKDVLDMNVMEPNYEKDFLKDINKLKNIYKQNRSWIDVEVAKRMKIEDKLSKKFKTEKNSKDIKKSENDMESLESTIDENNNMQQSTDPLQKKVTYADSLKADVLEKSEQAIRSKRSSDVNDEKNLVHVQKRKLKKQLDSVLESSSSDDELQGKDNRYTTQKPKPERKKYDRQKLHKKQKRRNKYEQWEMKEGYMKDYDDTSINSGQENEFNLKNSDKNIMDREFDDKNKIDVIVDADKKEAKRKGTEESKMEKEKKSNEQTKGEVDNWFDRRAAFRNDARHKLGMELFGEGDLNNAAWYFRRMRKREKDRSKGENSTFRKNFSKRKMNYKMKR